MRLRLFTSIVMVCSALTAPLSHASKLDTSRYPTSSELVLANLPAEIQPLRSARIKSPAEGALTLHLPEAGTRLAEGAIWGEFDPERLQLETEAFGLARTLLAEKDTPKLRLELARSAAQLVERRAELARQSAMLARIADDPALADLYADEIRNTAATTSTSTEPTAPIPQTHAAPVAPVDKPAALVAPALLLSPTSSTDASGHLAALSGRLQEQLTLIDAVLRYAGTPREDALELRALALKLKAQELDLTRRQRDLRLSMPFEGEITLLPPAPSPGKPLRAALGDDLALIQDFSVLQARVPIRRPEWRMLPTRHLQLRYTRSQPSLCANYERSLVREQMGREELLYLFRFPDGARDAARALVGGQVTMQLVLQLDQPALIVPKLDLILASPEGFRAGGWESAINAALPGARLLAQGETHLALLKPTAVGTITASKADARP